MTPEQVGVFGDYAREGFAYLDQEGCYQCLNKTAEAMLGVAFETVRGRRVLDVFPQVGVHSLFWTQFTRSVQSRQQTSFETHSAVLGIPIEVRLVPPHNADGMYLFFSSIAERKRIEAQREADLSRALLAEARTSAIIGTAMDAIVSADADQNITVFNEAAESIFGYQKQEVIGKPLTLLVPEAYRKAHQAKVRAFAQGGKRGKQEFQQARATLVARRKDGALFPIEASISHIRVGGDEMYTAFVRDITDRLAAEHAVLESERRFRSVADHAPVMIWTLDKRGDCDWVNKHWLEYTGQSLAEAQGTGWLSVVHPDDVLAAKEAVLVAAQEAKPFQIEYRLRRKDGVWRMALDSGLPRTDAAGEIIGYIGSIIDVQDVIDQEQEKARYAVERAAAQEKERLFLRQVLSMLTEGRLKLCDTEAELPPLYPALFEAVSLSKPTLGQFREHAKFACSSVDFDPDRTFDFITAIGEATMNAVIHAKVGNAVVGCLPAERRVQAVIRDEGNGIASELLHRATLERGFSTSGTLGHGFSLMLSCADRVWLLTGDTGTVLVIEQDSTPPQPEWIFDDLLPPGGESMK